MGTRHARGRFGGILVTDRLDWQTEHIHVFVEVIQSVQAVIRACNRLSCGGMVKVRQHGENGAFSAQHRKEPILTGISTQANSFRSVDLVQTSDSSY